MPHELKVALRTLEWGPPWPGGWMEWPAGMVTRMTLALNYYRAFESLRDAAGEFGAWWEANPAYGELVDHVMALRAQESDRSIDTAVLAPDAPQLPAGRTW